MYFIYVYLFAYYVIASLGKKYAQASEKNTQAE